MEPFKEQLNLKNVQFIGNEIKSNYPEFNIKLFLADLEFIIPQLELKQRIDSIAKALVEHLPQNVEKSFSILVHSAVALTGFKAWPLVKVVELIGMHKVDLSLETLLKLTPYFSAEFSIRPFLIHHEKKTLSFLQKNISSKCHHIRRLISEGTRPLLPWGEHIPRFKHDPSLTWHLLEQLKNDESAYVRKSVANHINDHSKNHSNWLIKQLVHWTKNDSTDIQWILKHGLRTLIKKGDSQALKCIGINHSSAQISNVHLTPEKIRLNHNMTISFTIKNPTKKRQNIIVDQKLFLLRANEKYGEKIFKGKTFLLKPKEVLKSQIKLTLKKVTTRRYYNGKQFYSLVVNGQSSKKISFEIY